MRSNYSHQRPQLANPPPTGGFITRSRVKLEPAFLALMFPVLILGFYIEAAETHPAVRIASRLTMLMVFVLAVWYRVRPVPKRALFKRSHVLIYWITVGAGIFFLIVWPGTSDLYRRPVLASLFTVAIVWSIVLLIWKVRRNVLRPE